MQGNRGKAVKVLLRTAGVRRLQGWLRPASGSTWWLGCSPTAKGFVPDSDRPGAAGRDADYPAAPGQLQLLLTTIPDQGDLEKMLTPEERPDAARRSPVFALYHDGSKWAAGPARRAAPAWLAAAVVEPQANPSSAILPGFR